MATNATIRDVEKALEESEARFRNIIDNNADAIVVVDSNGIVRYANAAAEQMFQRDPGELQGSAFGFPLTAGATTEVDIVVDGGTTRPAEMRVADSVWEGESVCLATLRDVTDRELLRRERAAQLAASMAEARLRDIIAQAPVAIAVLGGKEHRFDIVNERYLELIDNRDVLGKRVRDAFPELESQGIFELLDDVFAAGQPYVGTEVALTLEGQKPGDQFFNFVYQPLRAPDGEIAGIAVVASDVTAQVRARRAVEQANQAKSDFLATMSHELRTPLNAIGGYADLILAGIRGPITDAQQLDLERIKRSQRHLLAVINDILNFAKLESGRIAFRPAVVSMNTVLGDLETLVGPLLIQKGLEYEYLCCDPKFEAYADPERVQQILLNLLSNAAKFTPAGGKITVECLPQKTEMVVEVTDNGPGIPPDKLQTIFEPFVQLERGRSPELGGTGLGLAISRDLARAMGGDLRAESEPGRGSTFRLSLPRAKAG